MSRQAKQAKPQMTCPHHGKELLRRRGCQSRAWYWYCPEDNCNHRVEGKHGQAKA